MGPIPTIPIKPEKGCVVEMLALLGWTAAVVLAVLNLSGFISERRYDALCLELFEDAGFEAAASDGFWAISKDGRLGIGRRPYLAHADWAEQSPTNGAMK